ncbi:hypothetical protein DPMN_066787 [Dreissena polymorpha]|uniref:Uncharacterized protein n=1 Tax=Dreissena polymorpha TaxID=45954 RepID=A0A9D3YUQ4_DREPO|nr:hypothetical protein DPMN_066787 [Dreissena polymorpha]
MYMTRSVLCIPDNTTFYAGPNADSVDAALVRVRAWRASRLPLPAWKVTGRTVGFTSKFRVTTVTAIKPTSSLPILPPSSTSSLPPLLLAATEAAFYLLCFNYISIIT